MGSDIRFLAMTALLVGSPACGLSSEGLPGNATATGPASGSSTSSGGGETSAGGAGGSGGAGASGGGAAGGGGGAGGGAGGMGETSCFNGMDDDNDMKTDCADEDCVAAGATCVRVPVGVTTFALVLPEASLCPTGMTPEPTKTCPGCGCTLTSPGNCGSKALFHNSTDCTDASPVEVTLTSACSSHLAIFEGSTNGESSPGGMGACTPDAMIPPLTPVMTCNMPVGQGAGCKGAQFCAPGPKPCIVLPNATAPCPLGYYKSTLVRDGATACAACVDCTVGAQTCELPDYAVYDDSNACNTPTDVVTNGACTLVTSQTQVSVIQQSSFAALGAQCSGYASPEGVGELKKICCQ